MISTHLIFNITAFDVSAWALTSNSNLTFGTFSDKYSRPLKYGFLRCEKCPSSIYLNNFWTGKVFLGTELESFQVFPETKWPQIFAELMDEHITPSELFQMKNIEKPIEDYSLGCTFSCFEWRKMKLLAFAIWTIHDQRVNSC